MALNQAVIIINHTTKGTFSLHKVVGGHPGVFVHLLVDVFAKHRQHVRSHPGKLIALLCAANGGRKAATFCVYPMDTALDKPHIWRYEITYGFKETTQIIVHSVQDSGVEDVVYKGSLEGFLTLATRRFSRRKPRGKTPNGYGSRREFETTLATNEREHSPLPTLRKDIDDEREHDPPSPVNLTGVTVYSKEEYIRRRNLPRKLGRK